MGPPRLTVLLEPRFVRDRELPSLEKTSTRSKPQAHFRIPFAYLRTSSRRIQRGNEKKLELAPPTRLALFRRKCSSRPYPNEPRGDDAHLTVANEPSD